MNKILNLFNFKAKFNKLKRKLVILKIMNQIYNKNYLKNRLKLNKIFFKNLI